MMLSSMLVFPRLANKACICSVPPHRDSVGDHGRWRCREAWASGTTICVYYTICIFSYQYFFALRVMRFWIDAQQFMHGAAYKSGSWECLMCLSAEADAQRFMHRE